MPAALKSAFPVWSKRWLVLHTIPGFSFWKLSKIWVVRIFLKSDVDKGNHRASLCLDMGTLELKKKRQKR